MDGKKGELKVGRICRFRHSLAGSHQNSTARDILKTEVLRTVVDGKTVYQKN